MYKCFISELLFREWQRSDEDTQSWDADNCTGKHQTRMRVRASEQGSGEGSGRFLVEHRAGDSGHTLRPQPGLSTETMTRFLLLLSLHSVPWFVHLANNNNSSNLFIWLCGQQTLVKVVCKLF